MGPDSRNRGFIVLGQPGIGKTLWLLFAVTKRLLARRPTFLQLVPGFLALFCEQGAFQFGQDVIEALDTNPNNLGLKDFYFIDSNERLITPPLSVIGTNARIIQITSPRFHRADWDRKNILRTITYFMKPLTRDEMLFASRYQSQSVPSLKDLSKFYVRYGPSARLAYAHASDQDQYEMELFKLIRAHNREELNSNLWRDLRFDFNSKVSPYLFLIRPAHDRQDCITAMISSHVCEKIKEHLADEWTLFAKEIYDACLSQPFTRSGAGEILKNRLHDLLRNGHPWHVHPMVKLSAGSDTDTVYVTESNITKRFYLHPPHLQPTDASHTRRSLELCLFDIDGLSREQISSGVYYRPLPPVQTTFDSFICDPEQEKIYVFRFTVSAKHDVQHSGLVMLEKLCPGFKIIYITFTPTFKLKLPFGKQSEQLVVEKWHAMVSSDMLFAVNGGKW
ncbi:hypothetical protein BT96DRAFT_921508 [Gymnopus androsaceus JB14]|uniref:Uncharacterized protein n=1 Tax=Gymnopus androsaceus JB14 TaxID=1447944 RepID=A0A6A4HIS1_9AGAR|nr:hypothetical protein BT96DRAFT_921508 [Gymnopus androsaceus JB14]